MTLIALDVDGTLMNRAGDISAPVRQVARAALKAGHHLVVATGRSRAAATPVTQALGVHSGYVVCANGGMVLRGQAGRWRVIEESTFTPRQALSTLREHLPQALYGVEAATGEFFAAPRFHDDASFGVKAVAVPFEALLDLEAVRVVVHHDEISLEEFEHVIEAAGLQGVTYSVGWSSWLDIAAPGVNKATALESVRAQVGAAVENTIAVGDGYNDIEMLVWAHHGVAMGDAPEPVKAAANQVTGTVGEDGLVPVLASLL